MTGNPLTPTAAFSGLSLGPTGKGIVVVEREGIGLATVIARKGRREALSITLRGMGIEIPEGPRRSAAGDLALIGTDPGTWLATHERGWDALKTALAPLDAGAAIADQS